MNNNIKQIILFIYFQKLSWCSGWPLAISGALVLHLGILDESLLRQNDLYLCIKPPSQSNSETTTSNSKFETTSPYLCVVWRCQKTTKTQYYPINLLANALSPLAIEMLADDIPQLLQSLLVGVERALYRISLDDLSFPLAKVNNNQHNTGNELSNATTESLSENNKTRSSSQALSSSSSITSTTLSTTLIQQQNQKSSGNICTENDLSTNDLNTTSATAVSPIKRSIECTLKRSKIISGGNKHSLKRFSNINKIDIDRSNLTITNNFNNSINASHNDLDGVSGAICNDMTSTTNAPSSCETVVSMPLFCLGGEFPHIDSDEESSSDDMKRTSDAGMFIILQFNIFINKSNQHFNYSSINLISFCLYLFNVSFYLIFASTII